MPGYALKFAIVLASAVAGQACAEKVGTSHQLSAPATQEELISLGCSRAAVAGTAILWQSGRADEWLDGKIRVQTHLNGGFLHVLFASNVLCRCLRDVSVMSSFVFCGEIAFLF